MAEKKRRKPVDKTKIEYVEPKPSWIKAVKVNDHNDVMGSIIQFFLVESPCKGVSSRGNRFSIMDGPIVFLLNPGTFTEDYWKWPISAMGRRYLRPHEKKR